MTRCNVMVYVVTKIEKEESRKRRNEERKEKKRKKGPCHVTIKKLNINKLINTSTHNHITFFSLSATLKTVLWIQVLNAILFLVTQIFLSTISHKSINFRSFR